MSPSERWDVTTVACLVTDTFTGDYKLTASCPTPRPSRWAITTVFTSHDNFIISLGFVFGRFALCYPAVVCLPVLSVCDVGVLWSNGWMDQDATRYECRPLSRSHCVVWGPSSPSQKRAQPPISAHVCYDVGVLLLNGCMDQDATRHGGRPRPRRHCVRWDPAPCMEMGTAAPTFRPMSVVAKRSPISATTELLYHSALTIQKFTKRLRGLHSLSCANWLELLNTDSRELHRLKIDLVICKIMLSSSFAVDRLNLVQFHDNVYCTRGHNFRLMKQHHTVNCYLTALLAASKMHGIPYRLLLLTLRVWAVLNAFSWLWFIAVLL